MGQTILGLLETVISILYGAITGVATGIGQGLSSLVQSIMIASGDLSIFAGIMFMFMGIALAIGLSRYVLGWLTSLGRRK